jgi:hypothetical protein
LYEEVFLIDGNQIKIVDGLRQGRMLVRIMMAMTGGVSAPR